MVRRLRGTFNALIMLSVLLAASMPRRGIAAVASNSDAASASADAAPTANLSDADGHFVEVNAARPLLAGLLVNGRDDGQSVSLLRQQAGYAVDLDGLAAALAIPLRDDAGVVVLVTPLGEARIGAAELTHRGTHRFVLLAVLAPRLGARMRFDVSEFALRVDLPWRPGEKNDAEGGSSPATPDIHAPEASLSRWHSEVYSTHAGGRDTLTSLTDLGGALGAGAWRMRYRTIPGSSPILENYGWFYDHGGSRLLLGHDQLTLDPLLPYAELTGVQYAWSNRPRVAFGESSSGNALVGSQLQGGRVLSGEQGPPGGIAELRINDHVVARTAIHLDGTWQFSGIVLGAGDQAEVALYERFGDGVPKRVVQINAYGNAQLLPRGATVSYLGAGIDGNPLNRLVGTHGVAGFYQWRYGLASRMSVGATVQHTAAGNYAVASTVLGLGPAGTWVVGGGRHGRAGGWSLRGDGIEGRWFWHAFALHNDAGYLPGVAQARDDRYGEFGARIGDSFSASLVGRDVSDPLSGQTYRYLKPAFTWQPSNTFSASARPDYRGDYAYAAEWDPQPDQRLSLSRYVDQTQLDWQQGVAGDAYQLDLSMTRNRRLGDRFGALLSGVWVGSRPVRWSAGPLVGEGHWGYLFDAGLEAVPGLTAHVQVLDDPLNRRTGLGTVVQMVVVADFAVTPSGLARGGFDTGIARRGAISGRIDGELPEGVSWADLAGVTILVDGRPRGRLDASGHYLVQDLAPGVYQVQLDSEKLPIELRPDQRQPWVEVRAGVTTHADFAMHLVLGFAGRITDARGQPLADRVVEVVDGSGHGVAKASSNAWGYYRVDGLPPGHYVVHAGSGTRAVALARRFLFAQDVVAP